MNSFIAKVKQLIHTNDYIAASLITQEYVHNLAPGEFFSIFIIYDNILCAIHAKPYIDDSYIFDLGIRNQLDEFVRQNVVEHSYPGYLVKKL